jgi:hypothetical protein
VRDHVLDDDLLAHKAGKVGCTERTYRIGVLTVQADGETNQQ